MIDPVTGETVRPASAKCCTSDISLAEFKTLKGKMDAANPNARTVAEYLDATVSWRSDVYTGQSTVLSHAESIDLFKRVGVKFTPELKTPSVVMPYEGDYTQQDYAQQMINEYVEAGVDADDVFAQSFNLQDVQFWLQNDPRFGQQAVWLDGRYDDPAFDHSNPATWLPMGCGSLRHPCGCCWHWMATTTSCRPCTPRPPGMPAWTLSPGPLNAPT